jgi:hypothetical protein
MPRSTLPQRRHRTFFPWRPKTARHSSREGKKGSSRAVLRFAAGVNAASSIAFAFSIAIEAA